MTLTTMAARTTIRVMTMITGMTTMKTCMKSLLDSSRSEWQNVPFGGLDDDYDGVDDDDDDG